MAKLAPLSDTASSAVNSNNDKIAAAFQNTLSLDGSTPNELGADIDMNGFSIFNVGTVTASTSLTPFDYIESAGKIEVFTGQDGGWRDMIGQSVSPNTGPTIPVWTQMGSSPFYGYVYQVNDQQQFFYHLQHDYSPGTPIYLHAHWMTNGTNVQPVKWEFTYSFAKGFNQANYNMTGTTVTVQEAAHGSAWRHMTTEIATPITDANFEVDGILMVRLRRVTNGATENTDTVFLTMADCHYQSNTFNTKNRTPDFYV